MQLAPCRLGELKGFLISVGGAFSEHFPSAAPAPRKEKGGEGEREGEKGMGGERKGEGGVERTVIRILMSSPTRS